MEVQYDHLYDKQQAPVLGYCEICGGEIYSEEEGEICVNCREDLRIWHKKSGLEIAHEFDQELSKYLSDDLRDTIWNAVVPRCCGEY